MNPYLILQVPPEAGDAEIRRAYLDAIRQFPPEREPERFQAISDAYSQIRDEQSRLNYRLFNLEAGGATPLEVLRAYCRTAPRPKPLDFASLKIFLRSCPTK